MIGSLVDQNDIMVRADLAAQVGGGDNSAAASAQDHDPLSPAVLRHSALLEKLALGRAAPLLRADRQAFQVSQSLVTPLLLLAPPPGGEFFAKTGSCLEKTKDQFIGKIFKPFHQIAPERDATIQRTTNCR
jgi:hypothetical protein